MPKRRFNETHNTDQGSDGNQTARNTSGERSTNFLLRYTDRPSRRPPSPFHPGEGDQRAGRVRQETNPSRPFYVRPAYETEQSHSEQSQTFDVTREYATRRPPRPPLPPYRRDNQQGSEVFQEAGPSRAPELPQPFYVGPVQPYRSPEHLQMEGSWLASQNIQETGPLPPELHPENLPRRSPRLQSLSLHRESNPNGENDETNPFRPIFVRPANRQSERFPPPLHRGDDQRGSSSSGETNPFRPIFVRPAYEIRQESSSGEETGPLYLDRYETTLDQLTHHAWDRDIQVEVAGNDKRFARFHHLQGANDFQDWKTCFAAASEMILRQHDIKVNIEGITRYPTENDLLRYSYHRLGYHSEKNGMQLETISSLLHDFGVPNEWDAGHTVKDLTQWIEDEKSCLIGVCSKNWHVPNAPPDAKHIFSVTAVVYNLSQRSQSKTVAGFIIADTATEGWGKLFVDTERLRTAWGSDGGRAIVSIWSYNKQGRVIVPGKGL